MNFATKAMCGDVAAPKGKAEAEAPPPERGLPAMFEV